MEFSPSTAAVVRDREPPGLAARIYVYGVSVAGLAAVSVLLATEWGAVEAALDEPIVWGLVALVLAGELLPVRMPGEGGEETLSTTFIFSLMLTAGAPIAVLSQVLASAIADIAVRKPLGHIAFNLGQLSLSWIALVIVTRALVGGSIQEIDYTIPDIAAVAAGGAAFFAVNSTLVRIAEALSQGLAIARHITTNFLERAWSAGMLLGLALPIAAIDETYPALVPLVILPMAAIHLAARQSARMEYQALHDGLTELPNRALLEDRISQAIAEANRSRGRVGVILFDLDRLKEINDTLGHQQGDAVLRAVARRARDAVRGSDTVARFGGDEFGVVLPDLEDIASLVPVANRIRQGLSAPLELEGLTIVVEASLGSAVYPDHGSDSETLIRRADSALYRAKHTRAGHEIYASGEERQARRRLELVADLKRGIEEGHVGVELQPKVEITTGRMVGAEALARWTHPSSGVIPPEEFVPLAEHSGLITPLTMHVLRLALNVSRSWSRYGDALPVAVNLSARSLLDVDLIDGIERLLSERNLDANVLSLEITESTLVADLGRAQELVDLLGARGVRIAIDDFGQGYSSLAYLNKLNIAELKLDKLFVQSMTRSRRDAVIARSVIELGRELGIQVVAEGIERREEYEMLVDFGCPLGQGFFFAPPMPAEELQRWWRPSPAAAPVSAHGEVRAIEPRRRRPSHR